MAANLTIKPPSAEPSKDPDPEAAEERHRHKAWQNKAYELENLQLEQDLGERKKFAGRVYWMMVGWIASVLAIVVAQGLTLCGFHLDTTVLIALISGTTVNVLGIFVIVARYLFPQGPKFAKQKK